MIEQFLIIFGLGCLAVYGSIAVIAIIAYFGEKQLKKHKYIKQ